MSESRNNKQQEIQLQGQVRSLQKAMTLGLRRVLHLPFQLYAHKAHSILHGLTYDVVNHLEHIGRKEIHFGSPQHLCFDVRSEQVILQNCTEEGPTIHQQHWDFQENGMIVHILSGKCMEAMVQENNKDLYLRQCDGKASQLWRFDNVNNVDEH